jgi:ribosome-associated translation inhibitor RaiA
MNDEHKYDDIINLEHHVSTKHSRMSLENRSAQFAPFSALTGYEEAVTEEARITESRIDIDEEAKIEVNEKLNYIMKHLDKNIIVSVTYFEKDKKKQGGSYKTIKGIIKKIDDFRKTIEMQTGEIIKIEELKKIE